MGTGRAAKSADVLENIGPSEAGCYVSTRMVVGPDGMVFGSLNGIPAVFGNE
jgi:hypothetical protein